MLEGLYVYIGATVFFGLLFVVGSAVGALIDKITGKNTTNESDAMALGFGVLVLLGIAGWLYRSFS